jgi:hypothetical protein
MSYYKLVNGKRYGPYNYPRRTHYWTVKDLARVARHLKEKDKIDAGEILVAIAIALGMGAVFCKAAKAISSGLSIMSFIEKIAVVLAFGQAVTVLLEYLLAVKLVAPTWLKIILALMIALLLFIEKMLQAFNEFAKNRAMMMDAMQLVGDLCDKANKAAGIVKDKTCEALNADACYIAERKAEEIAFELQPNIDKVIAETDKSLMERFWQILQDDIHDGQFNDYWN